MVTKAMMEKYYRNPELAKQRIKEMIREKKAVVYGAKAVNKQLPHYLKRRTEDYDVFHKTPKETAREIEKALDKVYGGDYFETKQAKYPKTTKVINRITLRTSADVSKPPKRRVGTIRDGGISYANLEFQKRRIKKSLANPKNKFRHKKDIETGRRISLAQSKKSIIGGTGNWFGKAKW